MTRRTFLASASITACTGLSAVALPRLISAQREPDHSERSPGLLHAVVNPMLGRASIHTFVLDDGRCTPVANTLCAPFTALAVHPSLPILYGACDTVLGQSLPHGHIEAFLVNPSSSRLRSIARVAMSLSATGPRSLAVSPDGTSLFVAAASGGIWNVFPLDALGIPAPTPIARKELGSSAGDAGQAAAHPHSILHLGNARFAIATDTGSNQISLIEPSAQNIAVHARYPASPCAGPAHAALCANRSLLVANVLAPSLSLWQITGGSVTPSLQHVNTTPTPTPITALLAGPTSSTAYSMRPEANGSRFDTWTFTDDIRPDQKRMSLREAKSLLSLTRTATLPFPPATALLHHTGHVWAATSEGILQLMMDTHGHMQQASLHTPLPGLVTFAVQPPGVS
jgi:hypothetical protein